MPSERNTPKQAGRTGQHETRQGQGGKKRARITAGSSEDHRDSRNARRLVPNGHRYGKVVGSDSADGCFPVRASRTFAYCDRRILSRNKSGARATQKQRQQELTDKIIR